jgi:hypothetical protein
MDNNLKQQYNSVFKSIFIIDPVKGERLQLAKLLKQENFLMMTYLNLADCFKQTNPIKPDLAIYVLRKNKNEPSQLKAIRKLFKKIHFIVLLTPDISEFNITAYRENGFTSIHKAGNQDMVKELIYYLMPECQVTKAEDFST